MFRSIIANFLLVLLGILLLTFFLFYLWLGDFARNMQVEQSKTVIAQDIQTHAHRLLEPQLFVYGSDQASLARFEKYYADIRTLDIIRIKVWDTESRVIYSDDESIIGKSFPDDEDLKAALGGLVEASIQKPTRSENAGETVYGEFLEEYVPIYFGVSGRPVGVIEVYYKMDSVNAMLSKIRIFVFLATFLVIAGIFTASLLLFWFLVRKRLILLVQAAHEVAGGNLEMQVAVGGEDEIGVLAKAFNFMTAKLKELYEDLEKKVQMRTEELEKDNKIMVGRELKMVQLKKEIEDLKKRINDADSDQKNG